MRRDGAFVALWHSMKLVGIDGPFPTDLCRSYDMSFVEKNRKVRFNGIVWPIIVLVHAAPSSSHAGLG